MAKKSRLGVPGGKGEGVGGMGILGVWGMHTYIWTGWAMGSFCTAQGKMSAIGSLCCAIELDETLQINYTLIIIKKRKKTQVRNRQHRTDLWLPRGRREEVGWTGSLGLVDTNYHIYI